MDRSMSLTPKEQEEREGLVDTILMYVKDLARTMDNFSAPEEVSRRIGALGEAYEVLDRFDVEHPRDDT